MEKAQYGDLEKLIKAERICEYNFEPRAWQAHNFWLV